MGYDESLLTPDNNLDINSFTLRAGYLMLHIKLPICIQLLSSCIASRKVLDEALIVRDKILTEHELAMSLYPNFAS